MPLAVSLFMSLAASTAMAVETPKTTAQPDDAHAKDHAELTKLREVTEKAINSRDFETLKPYLVKDNLTVITVDGQKFVSLDAFRDTGPSYLKIRLSASTKLKLNP